MSKLKKRLLTISLSLAMALSTTSVAFAAPKTPLHSINGGGTIFYPEYGNISETYGFNIRQIDAANEDGNAVGTMQFSWHYASGGEQSHAQNQYIMKADITYVNFDADGDEAWVGGEITKSNIDNLTFAVDPDDPNVYEIDPDPDHDGFNVISPVVGSTFHIRIKDGGATDSLGMLWFCPTMPLHVGEMFKTQVRNWAVEEGEGMWQYESLYELTNGNITIK